MHKDKEEHEALQHEHERRFELAQAKALAGDNRHERRRQAAINKSLDKKLKRRMKAEGIRFLHD